MNWNESTLSDLYMSTLQAFANTKYRQHSIDPVEIKSISWIPYLGMRTLFCKTLIESNNKEYNVIVLFKNVVVFEEKKPNTYQILSENKKYYVQQMFNEINDVNVRCSCDDFKWRFKYYNFIDHSLYGNKGKQYTPISNMPNANPQKSPGICKHIMKLMQNLNDTGILL